MPKFGGFNGGNMQGLLKQAQQMQQQLQKAQEELQETEVEGSSASGKVCVRMNGKKVVSSIKISPEVVDAEDVEMLEDLIMAAYNDAMEKAERLSAEKLGPFGNAGGLF